MAMSARVTNANGRIIGETRNGNWRYHQHDALGSTIALINDAGTVTNTFEYWPYGELRTPIFGNLPTRFLYCGQWGYYTDTTGRIYVRARTYRPVFTRWLTVDPLWPLEGAYTYAGQTPASATDPSGSQVQTMKHPQFPYFLGCQIYQKRTTEYRLGCQDKDIPNWIIAHDMSEKTVESEGRDYEQLCNEECNPKGKVKRCDPHDVWTNSGYAVHTYLMIGYKGYMTRRCKTEVLSTPCWQGSGIGMLFTFLGDLFDDIPGMKPAKKVIVAMGGIPCNGRDHKSSGQTLLNGTAYWQEKCLWTNALTKVQKANYRGGFQVEVKWHLDVRCLNTTVVEPE